MDRYLPHVHLGPKDAPEGLKTLWRRTTLLILAITLHNFPEGLAVGVAFGAAGLDPTGAATLGGAIALALGIGLQNLPEGLAIAWPLRRVGIGAGLAWFYGQLSAIVEPLGAVLGALLVAQMMALLPYLMAMAAGAMVFVVVEEVIRGGGGGDPGKPGGGKRGPRHLRGHDGLRPDDGPGRGPGLSAGAKPLKKGLKVRHHPVRGLRLVRAIEEDEPPLLHHEGGGGVVHQVLPRAPVLALLIEDPEGLGRLPNRLRASRKPEEARVEGLGVAVGDLRGVPLGVHAHEDHLDPFLGLRGEFLVGPLEGEEGGGADVGAAGEAEEEEDHLVLELGEAYRAPRAFQKEVHGLGLEKPRAVKGVPPEKEEVGEGQEGEEGKEKGQEPLHRASTGRTTLRTRPPAKRR